MNLLRRLTPGIGVKRWLLVVFLGLLLLALAFAHLLRQVSQDLEPGGLAGAAIDLATLQFLPYPLRGLIVGSVGVGLLTLGGYKALRVVTDPLRHLGEDQPLVEVIYQKRFLARGPRIVAIGGGTGLSALLRGLKEHTSNLTAVVTVADDGGSSGVLRHELGIPPVGDIRNCIAALADAEPLMNELLQYRFPEADTGAATGEGPGLAGHAVGNLLIVALWDLLGDTVAGLDWVGRLLGTGGRVLPMAAVPLDIVAEVVGANPDRPEEISTVRGQAECASTPGQVRSITLLPPDPPAVPEAVRAVLDAEWVVFGPGSWFTSVLPHLLVPGLASALHGTTARRLVVLNLAPQPGETEGFSPHKHLEVLAGHAPALTVDVVLADTKAARAGSLADLEKAAAMLGARLVTADVAAADGTPRHDPRLLAGMYAHIFRGE